MVKHRLKPIVTGLFCYQNTELKKPASSISTHLPPLPALSQVNWAKGSMCLGCCTYNSLIGSIYSEVVKGIDGILKLICLLDSPPAQFKYFQLLGK